MNIRQLLMVMLVAVMSLSAYANTELSDEETLAALNAMLEEEEKLIENPVDDAFDIKLGVGALDEDGYFSLVEETDLIPMHVSVKKDYGFAITVKSDQHDRFDVGGKLWGPGAKDGDVPEIYSYSNRNYDAKSGAIIYTALTQKHYEGEYTFALYINDEVVKVLHLWVYPEEKLAEITAQRETDKLAVQQVNAELENNPPSATSAKAETKPASTKL